MNKNADALPREILLTELNPAFTYEEIKSEQENDSIIGSVIEMLKSNSCKTKEENKLVKRYYQIRKELTIQDGVHKRIYNHIGSMSVKYQIICPMSLRKDILKEAHDILTAGNAYYENAMGKSF